MLSQASEQKIIDIKNRYIEVSKGVLDYKKFNQYAIVHHGSSIEGSSLTANETNLLLDEGLTPKNRPLTHSLMTVDHYNALLFTMELAMQKTELTIDIIQKISALIMQKTGSEIHAMGGNFDSSKGEFRKTTVFAGNRTFANYQKVPKLVSELIEYISENLPVAKDFIDNSILAFDVHFQLLSIHPFADGNGRFSRLVMNYIQAFHENPTTIVFQEDKTEYIDALENTRKHNDIEIFRKFMFNQSFKYFKTEIEKLTKQQHQIKSKDKGLSFLF